MKKIYSAALAAMFFTLGHAQQVQQVTVGDNLNYGITYNLPTTVLRLTVTASCTQTTAGTYAVYAEKFLGLDVALSDQTHWELKSIVMETAAQADPDRAYHIMFNEKGALPTFYLTEERCLWAINQKPEVTVPQTPQVEAPAAPLKYKPTDVLNADMLKAGSKSKQAELIAQEILSIRESRSELIRGEADNVPNDGRQLQLMLDNLTAQEEALLTFFSGSTTTTTQTRTFTVVPREGMEREVVFRLSSELGFVDADDLAGSPYYVGISVIEDNRLPEITDPKLLKKIDKGVAFCVPGKAHVRIFDLHQTLTESEIPMAQFGHVARLPQSQFTDKKKLSTALFAPTTGAIRVFEQSVFNFRKDIR